MTKLEALRKLREIEDYISTRRDNEFSGIQKEETMRTIVDLYAKIQLVIE